MAETSICASFAVLTSGLMCIIGTPGAYFNTIKRTAKYLCPADIVPPYIEVDLSELDVGQKLMMRDLKVHPALKLLHSPDQPICNFTGSRSPE